MEREPANNRTNMTFLQQDDRRSSSSQSSTDSAGPEHTELLGGASDALVLVTVAQRRSPQPSAYLNQQPEADTLLQGADMIEQQLQVMVPEADQHVVPQQLQQQAGAAEEAAAPAAHTALQAYEQQLPQLVSQAVATQQQDVSGCEQQPLQVLPSAHAACSRKSELATAATGGSSSDAGMCWVQRTAGGPVSHPIVLDDTDDPWVWAELEA
jgi:hypothetical protein